VLPAPGVDSDAARLARDSAVIGISERIELEARRRALFQGVQPRPIFRKRLDSVAQKREERRGLAIQCSFVCHGKRQCESVLMRVDESAGLRWCPLPRRVCGPNRAHLSSHRGPAHPSKCPVSCVSSPARRRVYPTITTPAGAAKLDCPSC
jgi:hypothetical protein